MRYNIKVYIFNYMVDQFEKTQLVRATQSNLVVSVDSLTSNLY